MSKSATDINVHFDNGDLCPYAEPQAPKWVVSWNTIYDGFSTFSYECFSDKDEALAFAYDKAGNNHRVLINGILATIETTDEAHIVRGQE